MTTYDPDLALLRESMLDPGAAATISTVLAALLDAVPGQGDLGALVGLHSLMSVLRAAGVDPSRFGGDALNERCRSIVAVHGPARLAALASQALIETRPDESRHHWLAVAKALHVFSQVTARLRREQAP